FRELRNGLAKKTTCVSRRSRTRLAPRRPSMSGATWGTRLGSPLPDATVRTPANGTRMELCRTKGLRGFGRGTLLVAKLPQHALAAPVPQKANPRLLLISVQRLDRLLQSPFGRLLSM